VYMLRIGTGRHREGTALELSRRTCSPRYTDYDRVRGIEWTKRWRELIFCHRHPYSCRDQHVTKLNTGNVLVTAIGSDKYNVPVQRGVVRCA
jgi:uncharacterized protein YjlB